MTRRPEPLSMERHRAIGAELSAMRDRLIRLAGEISGHYLVTSPVGKSLPGIERGIDRLRSALDDSVARDYPAEFSPGIYYKPHDQVPDQRPADA